MKLLSDFYNYIINESVTSNTEIAYDFATAKEFFETDGKTVLEELHLKLSDIEVLYEIAAGDGGYPAPVVIRYGAKGAIAFRRWVGNKLDVWAERTGNKIITEDWFYKPITKKYKGPHNTRLGTDVTDPTAADMENIIAFSFNKLKINTDELTESDLMYFSTNGKYLTDKNNPDLNKNLVNKSSKIENLLEYCQKHSKFVDNLGNSLFEGLKQISGDHGNFYKLGNEPKSTSDIWYQKGKFTDKVNNTPKTDICSEDGEIRISVKKDKGSQLTSASYHESLANILCAIDNMSPKTKLVADKSVSVDKDGRDDIIAEFEKMYNRKWDIIDTGGFGIAKLEKSTDKSHIDFKNKIQAEREKVVELQKYLNDLVDKSSKEYDEDFTYNLLLEAASGNVKFSMKNGKPAKSSANYIFVWENDGNGKLWGLGKNSGLPDYIDYIMKEGLFKIDISFKTAKTSYMALRIIVK